MTKSLAVLGAALSLTLGVAPGVAADDDSTSPSPTSPGTEVSLDSDGAPIVTPEQKIDPYVRSSIVYITIDWEAWLYDKNAGDYLVKNDQGEGLSTVLPSKCTGYVVNPDGWIATAGHCVSPEGDQQPGHSIHDDFVTAATNISMRNGYWDGIDGVTWSLAHTYWEQNLRTEPQANHSNKPDRTVKCFWGANVSGIQSSKGRTARVMGFQQFNDGDGALLKVNEPDMNALLLVPGDTTVDTGTAIAAVGYAGSVRDVTDADYHPSVKTGHVSSQKTRGDIPVYEIDAAVSPGMSGGPTVNDQGQVVGTNSFGPAGESQSFNFVGTSQRILELLNSEGTTNELSQDSQDMRAGLDAYFAGDKATAETKLSAVHENQPANDVVTDYLARAKALPDAPEEDDSAAVPGWLWASVAVLAVLAAALVGVLLLRRRRLAASSGGAPASLTPPRSGVPAPSAAPAGADSTVPMSTTWTGRPVPTAGPTGTADEGPGVSPGAGTTAAPGGVGQPSGRGDSTTAVRPTPAGFGAGAPPSQADPPRAQTPVGQGDEEAAPSRFCTLCGAPAAAGQKFCGACGNAL